MQLREKPGSELVESEKLQGLVSSCAGSRREENGVGHDSIRIPCEKKAFYWIWAFMV